jgi:radical SAM protein with 4Fe4S-binding SPASM domain
MACRRFESYVGTVDEKMHDIFNGKKMNFYRRYDNFKKCSRCELLRFCRGCPAVAYGYSQDFYAPDPQCWKVV